MDYSRMIHDYLDGELDQMQQDILFAELATNQDMRVDFSQQVKLQVVAQSDMAMITPPMEATNTIFASLGFSIPSEEYLKNLVGDTVATSPITSIKRFWVKYFALNVILLLMLLTTGTMLVMNPDILNFNGGNKSSIIQEQNVTNADNNNFSGMSSIPIIRSIAGDQDNSQNIADNGSVVRHSSRNPRVANDIFGTHSNSRNQSGNSANTVEFGNGTDLSANNLSERHNIFSDNELISDASQDMNLTNSATRRVNSSMTTNSNVLVNPTQSKQDFYMNSGTLNFLVNPFLLVSVDNTNWTIQVRRLALNPAQSVDLSQTFDKKEEIKWNKNLAISAMYKTNPYWSFGFEIGWEAFNQVFKFVDESGQSQSQRQSPQLMWYGATCRFIAPEFLWEDVLYPYGQFTAGGTSVGPLVRLQVGLMLQPTNLIRLNAGYESAGLFYKVNPNYYGSLNHGFTFGGSVNF
ncbi:MAG: hypothetical protein M1419_02815 [Bacteroidetes bacterium]|nr:hypothetical protein [Bacteroidota bacterium]